MNFSSEAVASWYGYKKTIPPSDVSNEEWEFVAPYLALVLREDAPQRDHDLLREVFNGL
jgi:hypothetical protein